MIPLLDEEGRLPSGVHETDLAELREKMGWSGKRRALIEGLEGALDLMDRCGVERVYLDGSFVTYKDRPKDIDGCYDIPDDAVEEDLRRMTPIFSPSPENRARAGELFGVDFFPVVATELGSGQPFLWFFRRTGRAASGAC